jgi:hypothetical protein
MKYMLLRFSAFMVAALIVLGAWGWMLPDRFCLMETGCDCDIEQECCAPVPSVSSQASECCLELDSYFNFPVFGLDRVSVPHFSFSQIIQELSKNVLNPFRFYATEIRLERPPPLQPPGESLYIPFCTFRV